MSPCGPEATTIPPLESVELPITKSPPGFWVKVETPLVIMAMVVEKGGGIPAHLLLVSSLSFAVFKVVTIDVDEVKRLLALRLGGGGLVEDGGILSMEDEMGRLEELAGPGRGVVDGVGP